MGGFPYAGRIVASRDDAPFRVLLGPTSFTPASVVVNAGDDIGWAFLAFSASASDMPTAKHTSQHGRKLESLRRRG